MKVKNKQCAKHQRKSESRKQLVRKTPTLYLKQKTGSAQNTKVLTKAENKCFAKHQPNSKSRKEIVRKTPT